MLVGVVSFLGSEVVLSPVVSGCLPSCGGWVLVGVAAFLGSEVVLPPVVSGCLPSCGGWVLVGMAASRTKTFRNQNHRFQSKFAYCKLFGVYAGVITFCFHIFMFHLHIIIIVVTSSQYKSMKYHLSSQSLKPTPFDERRFWGPNPKRC